MRNTLSQNEKEFFIRLKGDNLNRSKVLPIAILIILIFGVMIDAFNGFFILRNARSLVWAIGGLFLIAVFFLIGEAGSEWINSTDDVSRPLLRRFFYLFILFCIAAVVTAACWVVFIKLA